MTTYQELLGRNSCPVCGAEKPDVLAVIDQDGAPPCDPEHNIGYYHVMLARCRGCGCGLLERLDHDCFDFDSVFDQYEWYILSETELGKLLEAVNDCPQPVSPECQCQVHNSLRRAIQTLPRKHWQTPFEDKHHEHRVAIVWKDKLPHFRCTG